jgi:hypothetical protein
MSAKVGILDSTNLPSLRLALGRIPRVLQKLPSPSQLVFFSLRIIYTLRDPSPTEKSQVDLHRYWQSICGQRLLCKGAITHAKRSGLPSRSMRYSYGSIFVSSIPFSTVSPSMLISPAVSCSGVLTPDEDSDESSPKLECYRSFQCNQRKTYSLVLLGGV